MRGLLISAALFAAGLLHAEPVLVLDIASVEGDGVIEINLRDDIAPKHVERIVGLAKDGAYDNVAFHRVIDGFMAQTGDVEFGKINDDNFDMGQTGRGGSKLPDLGAEFSDVSYETGVVGMARSKSPDSANSQFFIMLAPGHFLNGEYTVIGEVINGQDVVNRIKKGDSALNGSIIGAPDYIRSATIREESLKE